MPKAQLFDEQGRRFFFNEEERKSFIQAAAVAPETTLTFCSLLHYTGCNFTEALNFTTPQVDCSGRVILFRGLIPRHHHLTRSVPVPDAFIALLEEAHDIRRAQSSLQADQRVWPQSKKTMHEKLSRIIAEAGISGGPHAVPKGIRHGFLVQAIRQRIDLTRITQWMGFSHINYLGEYVAQLALHSPELLGDERADAALLW